MNKLIPQVRPATPGANPVNNRERKAAELDARTREVGVRLAELSAAPARDVLREVNPVQKARIVRALKADGHTVGFLGDGIDDAVRAGSRSSSPARRCRCCS